MCVYLCISIVFRHRQLITYIAASLSLTFISCPLHQLDNLCSSLLFCFMVSLYMLPSSPSFFFFHLGIILRYDECEMRYEQQQQQSRAEQVERCWADLVVSTGSVP